MAKIIMSLLIKTKKLKLSTFSSVIKYKIFYGPLPLATPPKITYVIILDGRGTRLNLCIRGSQNTYFPRRMGGCPLSTMNTLVVEAEMPEIIRI